MKLIIIEVLFKNNEGIEKYRYTFFVVVESLSKRNSNLHFLYFYYMFNLLDN